MRSLSGFASLGHRGKKDVSKSKTASSDGEELHKFGRSFDASYPLAQDRTGSFGLFLMQEIKAGKLNIEPYIDEASIVEPKGLSSDDSTHVEYAVKYVLTQSSREDDIEYVRFTKFKDLHERLKFSYPNIELPKLPQTRWLKLSRRSLDPSYIERKSAELTAYLQQLAQTEVINTSEEFLTFLFGSRFNEFEASAKSQADLSLENRSSSASIQPINLELEMRNSYSGLYAEMNNAALKLLRKDFYPPNQYEASLPLYQQKSLPLMEHPFLSKLVASEEHTVSFASSYKDQNDLVSSSCLIMTFLEDPLAGVQLSAKPASISRLSSSQAQFRGKSFIDGYELDLYGNVKLDSLEGQVFVEYNFDLSEEES